MRAPRNFPHYDDGRPMGTLYDWRRALRAAASWYGWSKSVRLWSHDAPSIDEALALRAGAWMVKHGLDRPAGDELPGDWSDFVARMASSLAE